MKFSSHNTYTNNEGEEVPSATTILTILNKPKLMKWANFLGFKRKNITEVLESSAELGSMVHDIIEKDLTGKEVNFKPGKHTSKNDIIPYIDKYINWKKENKINPIFMEKKFVTEKFGGTIDFYGEVNGKKAIVDFKTSKNFYFTMFLQLAAYCIMLEENEYEVEQLIIVRINMDKYVTKIIERERINQFIDIFLKLVDLFHSLYMLTSNDKDKEWGEIIEKK